MKPSCATAYRAAYSRIDDSVKSPIKKRCSSFPSTCIVFFIRWNPSRHSSIVIPSCHTASIMIRTRFYVPARSLPYAHDIIILAVHSHAVAVDLHVHVVQRVSVALLQAVHVLQQSVIHLAIAVHRLVLLVVLALESALTRPPQTHPCAFFSDA